MLQTAEKYAMPIIIQYAGEYSTGAMIDENAAH